MNDNLNEDIKRPYVVGVAGGTGSGKTTVAKAIQQRVGADNVRMLQHDLYYFDHPELSYEERCKINYDHPNSLDSDLLAEHLKCLIRGETVEVPIYDFTRHKRLPETSRKRSKPIIIVEGILVLAEPQLRELMDMKVFVLTDSDIRFIRRMGRDMKERNRDHATIVEQYLRTVKPMHDQFVGPSRRFADIIVPEGGHNKIGINLLVAKMRAIITDGCVL